jgi:hypothetical protein
VKNEKIYLVSYCGGSYEDSWNTVIFATHNKSTATKYVTKFNRILKKWKDYYDQFAATTRGFRWIKAEHVERHFKRWYYLNGISNCYYEEIDIR